MATKTKNTKTPVRAFDIGDKVHISPKRMQDNTLSAMRWSCTRKHWQHRLQPQAVEALDSGYVVRYLDYCEGTSPMVVVARTRDGMRDMRNGKDALHIKIAQRHLVRPIPMGRKAIKPMKLRPAQAHAGTMLAAAVAQTFGSRLPPPILAPPLRPAKGVNRKAPVACPARGLLYGDKAHGASMPAGPAHWIGEPVRLTGKVAGCKKTWSPTGGSDPVAPGDLGYLAAAGQGACLVVRHPSDVPETAMPVHELALMCSSLGIQYCVLPVAWVESTGEQVPWQPNELDAAKNAAGTILGQMPYPVVLKLHRQHKLDPKSVQMASLGPNGKLCWMKAPDARFPEAWPMHMAFRLDPDWLSKPRTYVLNTYMNNSGTLCIRHPVYGELNVRAALNDRNLHAKVEREQHTGRPGAAEYLPIRISVTDKF